jgi:hypothetical protein
VICRQFTGSSICQVRARAREGDGCDGTITDHGIDNKDRVTTAPYPPEIAMCFTRDGLYCSASTKKCTHLPAISASCTESYCADGGYCSTGTCAPAGAPGASCAYPAACNASAFCDDASKQCKAKLDLGVACNSSDQCASARCEQSKCGTSSISLLCATF